MVKVRHKLEVRGKVSDVTLAVVVVNPLTTL